MYTSNILTCYKINIKCMFHDLPIAICELIAKSNYLQLERESYNISKATTNFSLKIHKLFYEIDIKRENI